MTVSRTICLGFLALIVMGTGLLMLPLSTAAGTWNQPLVALFTATSAVCVTGLVVVDTGSYFSPLGELIILLLIQLGGLGYMTATTFLLVLLGRRLSLKDRLAIQQSMDNSELSGARALIVSVIATTLLLELTGIIAMMPRFAKDFGAVQGFWLATFHSISAFNNAGFSLFADSLVGYGNSPWIIGVISALVIFGGIGYQVIMEGYHWLRDRLRGHRARAIFTLNFKIVITSTVLLLALGMVAIFATEFYNSATLGDLSLGNKLLAAWFQSVITRTAGFNSVDIGSMENVTLFIVVALMVIGASPGSTGGGIKTTTFYILMVCTRAVLQGKEEVLTFQREIPTARVLKAVGVVMGSGLTILTVTTLISLTDKDFSFLTILFEVVSAFATVGMSTGITADLSELGKGLIIITMYVGRVGVLLFMGAILGDPNPSVIHYPEEDLLVG